MTIPEKVFDEKEPQKKRGAILRLLNTVLNVVRENFPKESTATLFADSMLPPALHLHEVEPPYPYSSDGEAEPEFYALSARARKEFDF